MGPPKPRTAIMPVWEVMSPSPATVLPDTSIGELIERFEREDYNAFPVVDAAGVLHGFVTKLDVLRLFRPGQGLELPALGDVAGRRVEEIMRRGVVTVEPDDPVAVAADLMVATGLRSLPVVERGPGSPVLRGMLSRGDLLRGLRVEARAMDAAT
jgi:CBS domain-containing protein